MLSRTYSAAISGVDAYTIEVETNATGQGDAAYISIVGLPDTAVKESRDRVKSAIYSCGFPLPQGATLINLAPADMKKEGAAFDLPIAISIMAAAGSLKRDLLDSTLLMGELGLDGSVRPVRGVLPAAIMCTKRPEIKAILVPEYNAPEARAAAPEIPVYGIKNLFVALDYFNQNGKASPFLLDERAFVNECPKNYPDFAEVKGQSFAKRAMKIAASGGHNVLFIGQPGTGKSMLAKRLPGILPSMTLQENLESSRIHSVMGMLGPENPLLKERPFRSPHHTVSDAGLLGGGQNPMPGEISLAHNGVLFLDEMPEYKRNVLEVLRQPIENGYVTVSRAAGSFTFPARFILIAAMNPCPCGHYGSRQRICRCTPPQIQKYRARISGPLLDRIDIHIEVPPLSEDELIAAPQGETTAQMREQVAASRELQTKRFKESGIYCNSQMEPRHLQEFCKLDKQSETHLRHSIRELHLSARAYDRILRVARTIADLEASAELKSEHIFEAIQYRYLDRQLW